MSNPIIRDCENYLVMEPCKNEQFLTSEETIQWLEKWLKRMDKLPEDLHKQVSTRAAAERLLDTSCDLEIRPGFKLEWFAIRLSTENYEV